MPAIEDFLEALSLTPDGPDAYRATHLPFGHGVVFGGQLLAQSVIAAAQGRDGMAVKTLHTVFARGARPDLPLEIAVEPMSGGRTFGTSTVTISQEGRLCTRWIALLHAGEPDLIRHAERPGRLSPPDEAEPAPEIGGAWEIRIVDGVDLNDPELVGPAELDVWTRFAGAPDDPLLSQALLAFASDGFLIGTAMRPHAGVGQAQAHRTLATGVISHTLTFHEPFRAGEWLLLAQRSPYAGRGRSYGTADVFQEDGALVASFVQDAMIRPAIPKP